RQAKPVRRHAAVVAPQLPRSRTSIFVLNGNGRAGAAGQTAERVKGLGYRIGKVGNAPRNDYRRSIVMYRQGFRPEALRLGRDLVEGEGVGPVACGRGHVGRGPERLDGERVEAVRRAGKRGGVRVVAPTERGVGVVDAASREPRRAEREQERRDRGRGGRER